MKHIIAILFVLTLVSEVSHSQISNSQEITIQGKVIHNETRELLSNVHIKVSGSSYGTITNSNGDFKIIVPSDLKNSYLIFTHLTYQILEISISEAATIKQFVLKENADTLNEVELVSISARKVVLEAISKIPKNYHGVNHKSNGFYRLTSQKNDQYVHLSEAVFSIFHELGKKNNHEFHLEKMRALQDKAGSKGIELGLTAKSIFGYDIVNRKSEFELLTQRGMKMHEFKYGKSKRYEGKEVYTIQFDQKDGLKKSGYQGEMLIDKESKAFLYFDLKLSPKGVQYKKFGSGAQRAMMKILGIKIGMSENAFQISYKKIKEKYYLYNVGNDAVLTFKSDKEHYNFETETRVDFLVTSIEMNATNNGSDISLGNNRIIENQESKYDQKFWDDHTIILPNQDFEAIANKIEANNNANNLKLRIEELIENYSDDRIALTDSVLSFYNKKGLFNGNALVTFGDEIIFNKSYNTSYTSNTVDTQFRVGSISKSFTAALILMLKNQGKLELSDPVDKFLPAYKHGSITIEQLLTHQSGIPNYLANKEYLTKIFLKTYSMEELVSEFCSDELEFEPGTKFSYSNSGYVILSAIIESVERDAFGSVLNNLIFAPLKMDNTYYGSSALSDSNSLAIGFSYEKEEPSYFVENTGGAGGIISTTTDLLKWSAAMEGDSLLPASQLLELFKPRADYTDWEASYGYGWMIDNYMFKTSKKHVVNYHPGTDIGFYSMLVKQPDLGITIVLLNNTGEFPRFEITDLILNILN